MKLLFVMRHAGYVRNFESTLRMLCARGHRVHVAFERKVKYAQLDPGDIAAQLAASVPGFSYGDVETRTDGWGLLGRELRLGLDYLRYLGPEYADAPKLRERAAIEAPADVVQRAQRGAVARRVLSATLRARNRAIPRSPAIDAFLREIQPDVVAVTPLIEPGSPQSEYLRSARALGMRTAYCVASWDNLTNKGLIHGPVDLVTVWNDAMKQEAVTMHGVPPDRVVVTGAAAFDHWFDWTPGRSREAFCARVGLPADRPFLLYLCSSKFVAPEEVGFVRQWLEHLRRQPPPLGEAGVLVRPHPQNAEQWEGVDLAGLGPVAVWPRAGAAPVDDETRGDYFESMYYSAAVVGINTTAEIESAIVGRPVHTILTPAFRDTQAGTLHFHHLRRVNGGLVHAAEDFGEHFQRLAPAVLAFGAPGAPDGQSRRFIEAFVRPQGIDIPSTPRLVDALERLAASAPPEPERERPWDDLLRKRMAPRAAELEQQARAASEASAARQAAKIERAQRRAAREADRQAELSRRVEEERRRRAERSDAESAERERRLEALIVDFGSLDVTRRRTFLRGIVDQIPPDGFVDLHAATPPRRLDYPNAEIRLRVSTKSETFRLRACAKEPFTVQWIEACIGPGEVLYDVGANVGVYSLVAAKKPTGAARVYAFEASYASIASLCANVVLNDAAASIVPMPVALSDRTGMSVFSLRDTEPGAARHALGSDPEDGPTVFPQPVLTYRLDELIDAFGLPRPHHVKLDVDGGELAVLEGASRTLASPELRTMLVEVSTALSGPVSDVLARHGLHLQSKISVRNKAGEYAVWYGLFAREAASVAALVAGGEVQGVTR